MRATALVQDITIHAQAVGVNETAAATAKLGKATDAALVSADKTEKRQLSLAGAYDRLHRSIDVNYRMQKQFDSGQKILTASLNGGRISAESYQRSIGLLVSKYGDAAQASARLAQANDNLAQRAEAYSRAVSPAHAAQERFNASIHEAEDLYTAGATSAEHYRLGVAKATAELNSATQAAQRNAAAQRLQAQSGVNQQLGIKADFGTDARAEDIAAYGRSLDALRAKYVPLAAAQQHYRASLTEINEAARSGALNEAERGAAIAKTKADFAGQVVALRGSSAANENLAKTAGLARHELINLGRQAQDVGTMLAMGASPMQVLTSQVAQIADIFMSSQGSVGGFFRQLMAWVTPMIPALAALTAAAVVAYNAFRVLGEKQDLSNSLLGTGRAAGVTAEQLNQLAVEAAASADMTVSATRAIAIEFTKTGKVGMENLSMLTKLTKDYAANTGMTIGEAAKEIAAGLLDTNKGLETATQRLGPLDSSYVSIARSADQFGEKLKAQKAYLDAVRDSTVGAEQAQSKFQQAMDKYVYRPASAVGETAAGVVLGKGPAEQNLQAAAEARAKVAALERQLANDRTSGNRALIADSTRELDVARQRLKVFDDAAAAAGRQAQAAGKLTEENGKINVAAALAQSTLRDEIALRLRNSASIKNNEDALASLRKRQGEVGSQRNEIGGLADPAKFAEINKQIQEITASNEKLKQQAEGQAKVTDGLTAQQQKSIDLLAVEQKYQGSLTTAQRIARAGDIADIENRDTLTSKLQRETDVRIAQQRVVADAANAHKRENDSVNDNVSMLERQIEVLRKGGVERAKIEELRQRAIQGAREENVPADVVMARLLRNEAAQQRKEITEQNAQRREGVTLSQQANSAAAGGVISAQKRADIEAEIAVQRQIYNKAMSTGKVTETEANKLAQEGVDLVRAANSERAKAAANNYLYNQGQTVEQLEKEISLIGQSSSARRIENEILEAKLFLQQQGIWLGSKEGQLILDKARKIGELKNVQTEQLRLQQQLRQSMDFAADGFKSFVEELLTGTDGINGALKSLGKGFLSASLDALISGKGPLAGITGMAANDNNSQGGIIGLLTKGITGLGKQVKEGAKEGTSTGVALAINTEGQTFLGGLGIDGAKLAGGLTAIAGLAGAYGSGMAASSYGQAVGGGAISGGMAGAALATSLGATGMMSAMLPGIGIIVGGALAYFGQKSARDAAKKQREAEAQENYRQAEPGIATLRSQLRGESQDTLENRIKATFAEVQKGIDVAFFAKKIDEANALGRDFGTYKDKSITDFQIAFAGLIDSLESGLGPNSAFSQARESVKSTGDVLKGFISDAAYAFGEGAVQIDQAREAAKTHALSILDGSKSLSMVATRMEEIRGAGAALQQLLVELGMSATEAAEAIQQDTIAALDRLTATANNDLRSKINESQGFGYLNEINALLKEVAGMKADGIFEPGLISGYLQAEAQSIIDGVQLTGDAYARLIAATPELIGNVHEFTGALKGVAREADIAARRLNAQDRLFGALNDTSSLSGQLAAYDRQALRERQAEAKAGNEAMVELERAQAAERYNIIRDFNQKALDDQKRALEEARSFIDRFRRTVSEYLDGLRAGADSPLSPQARLAAAQSQYSTQLGLAQGGDRDALNSITSYSSDLLDAAKAYYASSTGYQDIFAQIQQQLGALPDQLSETDLIVNAIEAGAQATVDVVALMNAELKASFASGSASAIAASLSTYFNQIDTSMNGVIDFNEMKTALRGMASESALFNMFTRLDTDASGNLRQAELIAGATGDTKTNTSTTAKNVDDLDMSGSVLKSMEGGISLMRQTNDAINSGTINNHTQLGNIWTQVTRAADNLKMQNQAWFVPVPNALVPMNAYAQGGYVSGPGSSTSDSISARLSDGEFVMRAAAVDRFGVGMLNQMNDNFRMPAVAMPVMAGGGSNEVVAELRAMRRENAELRAEVKALREDTRKGAALVGNEVAGVNASVRAGNATTEDTNKTARRVRRAA